jgi:hypothetical protein
MLIGLACLIAPLPMPDAALYTEGTFIYVAARLKLPDTSQKSKSPTYSDRWTLGAFAIRSPAHPAMLDPIIFTAQSFTTHAHTTGQHSSYHDRNN